MPETYIINDSLLLLAVMAQFELLKPRVSFETNERMLVERVSECLMLQIHDKTKVSCNEPGITGVPYIGFHTYCWILNIVVLKYFYSS